jgi:fumarylacetoacetase
MYETLTVDETHDPARESWVETANDPATDYPIQNLPFGVFAAATGGARVAAAIGDRALDLAACAGAGLLGEAPDPVLAALRTDSLNALMARPRIERLALRRAIGQLLDAGAGRRHAVAPHLVDRTAVAWLVPARIGDYTDFYASAFHATNVGSMFRPDNPLLPNYKFVPIGYHARASSIVASGTPVRRPSGQTRVEGTPTPSFGPSAQLDYELEVGLFAGPGNELGTPIPVGDAESHAFGLCLVNDWSARDIQAWEYQPLGPFLAKNFATTVSPWVVTLEALAPFRAPASRRPERDPPPLPYLSSARAAASGGFDLSLGVLLASERMRRSGSAPACLSRGNLSVMYWTFAQMIAHHTSNGCNLQPGDLLASGTVSGPDETSRGCLLELAWRGTRPVALPNGESRRFLEDGDEVILRGWCERTGFRRIGFGECRGVLLPASAAARD